VSGYQVRGLVVEDDVVDLFRGSIVAAAVDRNSKL
jgi:hypothetical protein